MSRRKRDHNSTLSHWTTKSKWSNWMKHQVHLNAEQKCDVLTEPGRTCSVFWGAFSEAWTSRRHWWTAPPPPQPCFDWSLRSSIGGPGFLFGSLLLLFEPQALPGCCWYNLDQLKIKLTYYKIKKTANCSKLPNEPVQCCLTLWAIWGTLAQATTRTEVLQQKTGEAW